MKKVIKLFLILILFGVGFFLYFDYLNNYKDIPKDIKDVEETKIEKSEVKIENFFPYSQTAVLRDDNNLFVVNYNTIESEWSGQTYHIDLNTGEIKNIESGYILKDDNKYFGVKTYNVDYEYNADSVGNSRYSDYILDENRLKEISDELGVGVEDLQIRPFGGKPVFLALVKFEYNPLTKEIKLLPKEPAQIPEVCIPSFCPNISYEFYVGNIKYPNEEFFVFNELLENKKIDDFDIELVPEINEFGNNSLIIRY